MRREKAGDRVDQIPSLQSGVINWDEGLETSSRLSLGQNRVAASFREAWSCSASRRSVGLGEGRAGMIPRRQGAKDSHQRVS